MGWKGTVRSMGAAVRAAERDAKRRQRELERQRKQYEKMQELEQSAYEVEVYENHIDVIQSLHKECSPPIDWRKIAESKAPEKPAKSNQNEKNAQLKADNYKPGFLDKLFNKEGKKRKELSQKVELAIKKDVSEYEESLSKWEEELKDWEKSVGIARSILIGEGKAKIEAIDSLDPFSEISNFGSSLVISVGENNIVEATINVHGEEIVPSEVKSLLKSGRLSVKKMPKGKFNEIFQDYVCSCVLRVSNELFSAIPDELVVVTAVDELLNTKTGHLEEAPILSACISRRTLDSLNLDTIDPSDSMDNFVHNMSFKKTKGFEAVPRVEPELLESA
uniref:Uncharacterized protein n=1 Tax=Candidatus Kentrum sp. LFY TaxID=2126342 RepID=A0A450UHY0_9GAMM|nr:MAG: hypothetical protein BECKLFY1418A_GA0070994_10218 [Candidatus Kentron sp. LFY]